MSDDQATPGRLREVFRAFLLLGLTSFGGPIAHLGYFRSEFVERRRWLTEQAYADLVALCQFLPGPASSQVGFALGLMRGGPRGALAAWTAFTLPSALLLVLFALGAAGLAGVEGNELADRMAMYGADRKERDFVRYPADESVAEVLKLKRE